MRLPASGDDEQFEFGAQLVSGHVEEPVMRAVMGRDLRGDEYLVRDRQPAFVEQPGQLERRQRRRAVPEERERPVQVRQQ